VGEEQASIATPNFPMPGAQTLEHAIQCHSLYMQGGRVFAGWQNAWTWSPASPALLESSSRDPSDADTPPPPRAIGEYVPLGLNIPVTHEANFLVWS